jgi:hypothetical protein
MNDERKQLLKTMAATIASGLVAEKLRSRDTEHAVDSIASYAVAMAELICKKVDTAPPAPSFRTPGDVTDHRCPECWSLWSKCPRDCRPVRAGFDGGDSPF